MLLNSKTRHKEIAHLVSLTSGRYFNIFHRLNFIIKIQEFLINIFILKYKHIKVKSLNYKSHFIIFYNNKVCARNYPDWIVNEYYLRAFTEVSMKNYYL